MNNKKSISILIVIGLISVTIFTKGPVSADESWWDKSWLYRKQIVIDHTKVAADLINFPVLINFISDADLASKAQNDCDDIVFTDFNKIKLNHEIEYYNSSTGELICWVNVTSLSSTLDTILYLYYGNSGCGNQENVHGVWDSNYVIVQHLDETSGTIYDSTQYSNDGTSYNGCMSTTGGINGGYYFDGVDDYIEVLNNVSLQLSNNITVEAWAKVDEFNVSRSIVTKDKFEASEWWFGYGDNNKLDFRFNAGENRYGNTTINDTNWHYLTGVYNGSYISLFFDGALDNNPINNENIIPDNGTVNIGVTKYWSDNYYKGILDEVRISNIARSATWITTEYNNYYNPSGFYSVGEEANCPYILTLTTSGIGNGTIEASPTGPYYYGDVVTIWANASFGSTFIGFSGSLTGIDSPQNLTFDDDESVDAVFTLNNTCNLTLTISGTGNGTIEASPAGPYYYGNTVTIWANASNGSAFTGFSGSLIGTITPQNLTMDGDKAVNAEFTLYGPYQLILTSNGTGDGVITATPDGPYFYGDVISISAIASVESTFVEFSGSLSGTTTPQNLTMDGDKAVNAEFKLNGPYMLTLITDGTGNGTIQISPIGPYYYGDSVTIWANASVGSVFTGFSGNLSGYTSPQILTMDENKTVNAEFTLYTPGPEDWWNIGWLYRKEIVIDHSMVTEDLFNFPVLIDVVDSDLVGHAQSDGDDIVFTDATATKLSHEIEFYNSSSGHLVAWVNVSYLSSVVDTSIYMYYGNSSVGSQQDVEGTWYNGFKAVYHLKESWSNVSGHFKDSTTNHFNGTLTDANGNSLSDTGVVGNGFRFYGDADFIDIGVIDHNYPITYSCWFKADNIDDNKCAFGRFYSDYYLGTWNWDSGYLRNSIYINSTSYYKHTTGISNVWYHLAVTYDGAAVRYYVNGLEVGNVSVSGSLSATTSPWYIGDNGNAELFFKGVVDEVRLANVCFSSGWINTYYHNLNNPSSFYAVGVKQTQSGLSPDISNELPVNQSINIGFNPLLQADVYDPDGDMITCELWTNASGSWQLLNSNTFTTGSGTISGTSTNMINPLVKYWWQVRSTDDDTNWVSKTYWFITGENMPLILDASPHNNIITNYNPRLSVNVIDYQNDILSVTFRVKVGDTWETLGTYSGYSGLFTQNTTNIDIEGQTYYWCYNVTDGKNNWVNETRSFQVQSFVLKWLYSDAPVNTVGPLAEDINDDGIYEIFLAGTGRIICVNGSNGDLIWEYEDNQIGHHSISAISDLNNDGVKEIVMSCIFTQAGVIGKTIALHANNGSLFWRVDAPSDQRHLVVADIDGNGYPYVFVCSHINSEGALRKLRGIDGFTVAKVKIYYPCHGGLSIADIDNDGSFELILADYSGEPGKGIHSYDPETLKLKWYIRHRADPQVGVLADVNKDGILDVITSKYSNGPVQVVDGATISSMSGYSGLKSPTHSPVTVYDIDGDGNLEVLVCLESQTKVFDLFSKSLDATLPTSSDEPPFMADVIGDEKLEIISCYYNNITVYDHNYQKVETINYGANRWTVVQDIDNDGQNELVFTTGGDGLLRVYETSAYTPNPRVRTGTYGYSERATGAGVYIPPPGAPQPILKDEYPVNGSVDIIVNPILSVHAVNYQIHTFKNNYVVEYAYDKMNITISTNASGVWEDLISFNDTGNAIYNFTSSNMNQPDTSYYWRVTAVNTITGVTTIETYNFNTSSKPKINDTQISAENPYRNQPVNISSNISDDAGIDEVKLSIEYPDGSKVNKTLYKKQWTTLTYDDFENNNWGNYTSGGADCSLFQNTETYRLPFIPQGDWAVNIQGNSGVASSFNLTNPIDIKTPGYNAIQIDFWMNAYGMSDGYKYYLEYFDGTQWVIRKTYTQNSGTFDLINITNYNDTKFKFANWLNFHDIVWIKKSDYNFPTDMNIRFRCADGGTANDVFVDQIYINATQLELGLYSSIENFSLLGLYNYSFWCKDIHGNTNASVVKHFNVTGDISSPEITNVLATPSLEVQGLPVNISCNVQDNVGLQDVRISISDPNSNTVNYSIISNKIEPNTYYYTQVYYTIGTYNFYIWAKDVNGNANTSDIYQFNIYEDVILSEITSINAVPDAQITYGYVNISCKVTDNVGVDSVDLNISGPTGFTPVNISMISANNNWFYYNVSYGINGTYSYYIWVKDIFGNINISIDNYFEIINIPPILSSEVPGNNSADIDINPPLQVSVTENEGDSVDWWIMSNSSGSWNVLNNGTLTTGNGSITTTTTDMDEYNTRYYWSVNTKDSGSEEWTNETYCFTTVPSLSEWGFRKEITINHSITNQDLVDFPLLICVYDDTDLANHAQSSGNDILFTNDSVSWYTGTSNDRLSHEIEYFNNTSGNLTAWVNIPFLSSSQDTILYMYYGNSNCNNQERPNDVWDSSYVMVQHLDEISGMHYDSTMFNNDGTPVNNVDQTIDGIIDGADGFDGTNDYVHVNDADSLDLAGNGTLSAWFKMDTFKTYAGIVHKGDLSSFTDEAYQMQFWSNSKIRFYICNGAGDHYLESPEVIAANTWYHIVGAWNSSGRYLFVNGSLVASSSTFQSPRITTGGVNIGAQLATSSGNYLFDGIIDEVRISNVSRDGSWINASYNSQFDPIQFLDCGDEEINYFKPYILTLTKSGTGFGTIEVNSSGPFYYGDTVLVWANASVGSTFTGFIGSLTGINSPQNLTFDSDKSVYAVFILKSGSNNGGGGGGNGGTTEIPNNPPIANLSAGEPYISFIEEEMKFNGSLSYDIDGQIVKYEWIFGDGITGEGEITTHIYLIPGEYKIILKVTDNRGDSDSDETIAVVNVVSNNPPSEPVINGPTEGKVNIDYSFSIFSIDNDLDEIKYTIDWGDGNISESDYIQSGVQFNTSHMWLKPGEYKIIIKADDGINNITKDLKIIIQELDKPIIPESNNFILILLAFLALILLIIIFILLVRKKNIGF